MSDFEASARKDRPFLLQRKLSAELLTPVRAMLCLEGLTSQSLAAPRFLLESVEGGSHRARYSVIGVGSALRWSCRGGRLESGTIRKMVSTSDPLLSLRRLLKFLDMGEAARPSQPPMSVGLFGYMGYDAVRGLEKLPSPNPPKLGLAESQFVLPEVTVVFDAVDDTMLLTAAIYPELSDLPPEEARQRAKRHLDEVESALTTPSSGPPPMAMDMGSRGIRGSRAANTSPAVSNITKNEFMSAVEKAKQYILNGDIFQVVLSQRFKKPFIGSPFDFYRRLRRLNPSPFLFYFDFSGFGDFFVAGSSPEVMVRQRGGKMVVRPIAGTRRRGKTEAEDEALAAELLADEKELAEHLMLLDLGRNDIAKVAKAGSVKVTERMKVERYSHVIHMVSNVEGEVEPTKDSLDCLAAGFPAGTVSGAPKVRAMEIIDELEKERRELYAGAVGYFSAFGDMDTCIALRTAVIKDGMLYVQAGAGIVADSDPHSEFLETRNKAEALLAASRTEEQIGGEASDSLTPETTGLKPK